MNKFKVGDLVESVHRPPDSKVTFGIVVGVKNQNGGLAWDRYPDGTPWLRRVPPILEIHFQKGSLCHKSLAKYWRLVE
jgi:hypothetical protein